ncbi:YxeA family protein [Listeria sp. FSL L7-1485]|uniref:YxeA family protein n=1 Tax=Listeria immobilis TaxID=2713502 RepID=A0A7X0X8S0_9LIST|nr:YxeA family protein [Listeria immobilis]MBC1484290.1 YxeA family protein [Listeria immobilis]MBC1489705.1 YxeA family protein [Listeria immobilis]MBC1506894.1 YxeA family protein [Listeria immobilis]MBC1510106.1 YxeA family protein [Listeria immobilis]MBC1515582.1 YxeA family protein [Listeria immobilis]
MFTKKKISIILATILLAICAVWEYAIPSDAAVKPYYLKVATTGKPVKINQFKGYKYATNVYDDTGKQKKLTFYSEKQLTKDSQFKLLISENKMVVNYKKIKNMPNKMNYLAEK